MPMLVKLYFAWLLLSMAATTACALLNGHHGTQHWTFRLHGYFLNSAAAAWCVGVAALVILAFIYP